MVTTTIPEADSMLPSNMAPIPLKYDPPWTKNRTGYFLPPLVLLKKPMLKFSSEEKYHVVRFYFMN